MKKITAILLVVALVAVAIAGSTMAYFTDEAGAANVMTVGNVKIAQHEYERVVNADGEWVPSSYSNYGYTADLMQPFTQAKPAFPAVYADGDVKWDDRNGSQDASGATSHQQPWNQIGAPGSNQLFDDSVKNVIDKFVFVENTGKSDLYFRTLIAFEWHKDLDRSLLHTNMNANSRYTKEELGLVEIDGVSYILYSMTHNEALKPGETARPSLLQYFLDPKATNEDAAKLGESWGVLVLSQAVQTAGFADAKTALDTAFGKTSEKAAEWFGGEKVKIPEVVDNAADLDETLEKGGDAVLADDLHFSSNDTNANSGYGATGVAVKGGTLDGAGHTLGISNWGTWDAAVITTGGTIKNLTINSGMRGIFMGSANADVYIDNVTINGTVYTFNSDGGNKAYGVYISNSTLNGWTSHSDVHKEVVYTNCNFGEGQGYAFCRPYGPTSFVGCDFAEGFEIDPCGAVTFENCTIGGKPLTAANLATLVTSNIANATVIK